jgi:uncharacterized membrane protein YphA (DoxX/SURF4 family)
MTQASFPQSISNKTLLSRTGSLFIKMGRGLTKRTTIVEIISALLIILFIYTGINKIMDFTKFKYEMGRSPFIQNMAGFTAYAVPLGELLISLLLIIKKTRLLGLYMSSTLMALFTGYIWLMLNYAYDLPCSCGGIISKMSWDDHLKFNAVFTLLALTGVVLQSRITVNNKSKLIQT